MSNNEQPEFNNVLMSGRFLAIPYTERRDIHKNEKQIALDNMALADSLGYEVISITPTHIFMQRERNYEESQLRAANERKSASKDRAMLRKRNGGFLYGDFVHKKGNSAIGEVINASTSMTDQVSVRWPDETDFTKSHVSVHNTSDLILADDNEANSNER